MTARKPSRENFSRWIGFKNLLGVGMHLLLAGLLLEALTIVVRQWISFPIPLAFWMQFALSFPCVCLFVLGLIWFNTSINLAEIHLSGGENRLVTHGPFNYVRHPLYATFLITLPPLMIIWYADMLFFLPWVVIFIISHSIVFVEERGLIRTFGEDYKQYREHVPALLPCKGAAGRRYRESLGSFPSGEAPGNQADPHGNPGPN
jgi:protein-S-isoprenylcysteine O-methyltransferase Ste14